MTLAADIAMAGMDPMEFLNSRDPLEALTMLVVARRWFKRRQELDQQLADRIIGALAKAFK